MAAMEPNLTVLEESVALKPVPVMTTLVPTVPEVRLTAVIVKLVLLPPVLVPPGVGSSFFLPQLSSKKVNNENKDTEIRKCFFMV